MPLRRVMVDWGDKSMITNENKMGLYKNRKPYCEVNDNPSTVLSGSARKELYAGNLSVCVDNTPEKNPTGLTCKQQSDCPTNETCDLVLPTDPLGYCLDASGHPLDPKVECANDVTCDNVAPGTGNKCQKDPLPANILKRLIRTDEYQNARFGDLPRACTTEYFEFVHNYTCGEFELADPTIAISPLDPSLSVGARQQLAALGFDSAAKPVCRFVPKVQAMDNWGWCNGTESGGNPHVQGYYNLTGIEQKDYCDEKNAPFIDLHTPWTAYKGQIIVVPNK